MENYKKETGNYGEDLAVNFLKEKGYKILGRNYHCLYGEADVVADDGGQIVFVEVKTRFLSDCDTPEQAADGLKFNKLYNTALEYFSQNNIGHENFRLDLIAITLKSKSQVLELNHYENVY